MPFPGMPMQIEGETFILPCMDLGQLRKGLLAKLAEHDQLIEAGKTYEAVLLRGEIILGALRRNYPNFAEEKLMSHLDMINLREYWLFVLGASGFTPGEAPAATVTINGT